MYLSSGWVWQDHTAADYDWGWLVLLTGKGETFDVITGELGAPGPGIELPVLTIGVGELCPDIDDILPCSFTMGSETIYCIYKCETETIPKNPIQH